MKNVIVDIASKGQTELAKAIVDGKLNILGVTVSPDVENYAALANYNLEAVRAISDVNVYLGAQRPLLDDRFVKGKSFMGVGDTKYYFNSQHAVNFLIESAGEYDDLEIIALGPLTNIALAIMKDEAAMKRVKRIYVVGGALLGYRTDTPTSEYNILCDCEAADTVFKAGIPITLIPPHVSKNSARLAFEVAAGREVPVWKAYITIDTGIGFSRGQTVIDTVGRNPINGETTEGMLQTVVIGEE
ncbi:MAG: nucleoside hydrolase [Oscillospiraceae bacterium]|nr:nucleoside hydrolase [Oscillospiraceae bacterium]